MLGAGFAAPALAGPQYVDQSGFAASGHDVVAYYSLEQSPVGEAQPKAVPGSTEYTAEYNGATWAFSSEANRALFLANPEKYAPQYDGHCAYGVAQGGKVPGNPHLWRIVDGKLYLNVKDTVVGFWEEDIPGFIKTGDNNWSHGLESKGSISRNAPNYDSAQAPLKP
ncbi:MAG: YHS domain-containing protein [Neomegalonema sp.]|nr:YHS domain-containing protein [Neomegalonema sp.]